MTKLDKRKFVGRLAEEAEEAVGRQDLKTLYRINKMQNNGFKKGEEGGMNTREDLRENRNKEGSQAAN